MDIYLTRRALLQIEALTIISEGGEGILCGHKRGGRYFVEDVLSVQGVFAATPERMGRLRDLLQESFLGYFILDRREDRSGDLLGPGAVGKVLLDIRSRPEKKPSLTASVFDYDGAFRLLPIKIRKEA
jgi:hypothetical protein